MRIVLKATAANGAETIHLSDASIREITKALKSGRPFVHGMGLAGDGDVWIAVSNISHIVQDK